jgi:hypothetical protein
MPDISPSLMNLSMVTPARNSLIQMQLAYKEKIRNYRNLKLLKADLESKARAADKQVKSLKAELLKALEGAPAGMCDQAVLTVKEGTETPAAITLADGRRILWSQVKAVVVESDSAGANWRIPANEVTTLFGGRSSSSDIDVAGEV